MQNNSDLSAMNTMGSNFQNMIPPTSTMPQQPQGVGATMLGQMPVVGVGQGQHPHPSQSLHNGQQSTPMSLPLPPTTQEGAQQFCLRWNSYPATVATQLAALRAAEDFVDVTLACDGRQLRAHKLVLSACSPYFMQLFKSTPCQHPVIFLRDVGFRQLVALLEFMYAGEVNVSQAELPALLRTAEALQVRGLADTTANNNNNNTPTCPQPKQEFSPQYGQVPVMGQQGGNLNQHQHQQQIQMPMDQNQNGHTQQQNSNNGCPPMSDVPLIPPMSSEPPVTTATTTNNNNTPSLPLNPIGAMGSKSHRNSISGQQQATKAKEEDSEDSNEFDMIAPMDHSKNDAYMTDDNLAGQLEDTGQVFPDDPSAFGMGDGDVGNDLGMDNQSEGEEESSEEGEGSDEDDGEFKEFTYQSDASYSQEGIGEGEITTNGEIAGPSGLAEGEVHLAGSSGKEASCGSGGLPGGGTGTGSGRNRLSRSLWPPGIPYHGPQQCPYCPRILSNVGNWRKHVLTMHFAREKNFRCKHCSSAFRTAEYLQKHYVRVHNYPQKMTRRKYEGVTGSGGSRSMKGD